MVSSTQKLVEYHLPEKGYISANIYGNQSDRAVLALHGITHNSLFFDIFAKKAVEKGFCVIAPNLPGRGKSSYFEQSKNYNYKNYCDVLKNFCNDLKIKNPIILGSSMGGLISMMFLRENLNFTDKLILNDIGYFIPSEIINKVGYYFKPDEIYYSAKKIRDKISKEFSQSNLNEEILNWLVDIYTKKEGENFRFNYDKKICDAFWRGDKQKILPDFDFKELWQALLQLNKNMNVYLMRGEESKFFPKDIFDEMKKYEQVKNSYLVPGVGHLPLLYREEEISKILEFCSE